MTFLRHIEHSQWRTPTAQDRQFDRDERMRTAARGVEAILEALGELSDYDMDSVSEADIAAMEALQSGLELGLATGGMRDRVLHEIKRQRRRQTNVKAVTVFGVTLPGKGE